MPQWLCLLVVLLSCALLVPGESGSVRVVRTYGSVHATLLDLSPDGNLLLVRDASKVPCDKHPAGKCWADTLAVYRADTGKRVIAYPVSERELAYFKFARFLSNDVVSVVNNDSFRGQTFVEWNLRTGSVGGTVLLPSKMPAWCIAGRKVVLVKKYSVAKWFHFSSFGTVEAGEHVEPLQPGSLNLDDDEPACRSWAAADSFLLQGHLATGDRKLPALFLISTTPSVPYRTCDAGGAAIHGHAVSPDGSLAAIITSTGTDSEGVMLANAKVFLTILTLPACQISSRQELSFPERPQWMSKQLAPNYHYWAGARFGGSWRVAISPDKTKLAIGYGVRTGDEYSDARAFFGLYSLPTAQRLATWKADVFRNGLWEALRDGDLVPTKTAPLNGLLIFSPDSQALFAGSLRAWQWDLKGFKAAAAK